MRLSELVPDIKRAFGEFEIVWDEPIDLWTMVRRLTMLPDEHQAGFLGEILAALAINSWSGDPSQFKWPLEDLQDDLELGYYYSWLPRAATGQSKVTGRALCRLLAALNPEQRKVLRQWQELLIEEALHGPEKDSFEEEYIDRMQGILGWLSDFQETPCEPS